MKTGIFFICRAIVYSCVDIGTTGGISRVRAEEVAKGCGWSVTTTPLADVFCLISQRKFTMRTQTFMSSMVGVVAAVAVANSATASVTLDFSSIDTPNGYITPIPNPYGGFNWSANSAVMDDAYFMSNYNSGSDGIAGKILYTASDVDAIFNGPGTISLEQMVVGRIWPNISPTFTASTQLTITGYKGGNLVATKVVSQTNTQQTVTFSGAFGDIDKFSIVGSSVGGGYWYGGEIQYSVVPAPGAAALVGLAGLVATRRRRN